MNIKRLCTLTCLMAVLALASSCLGGDETEVTYYDDTAIIGFSLGSLQRPTHVTTSAGKDSVVYETIKGSDYVFYIDQYKKLIWNPDSLPCNTEVDKVVCTISAFKSGAIGFYDEKESTYVGWKNTDSLDLSYDRKLKVISSSSKYEREYTLRVNVRKQEPKLSWTNIAVEQMKAFTYGMTLLKLDGNLVVLGSDGTATTVLESTDGQSWTTVAADLDADAYRGAYVWKTEGEEVLRLLNGDEILSGKGNLQSLTKAETLRQLIGKGATQVFGLGNDGKLMVSADGGQTWNADTLATTSCDSKLPALYANVIGRPQLSNKKENRDIIVAWNENEADTAAVVWTKIENDSPEYAGWDYNDTHTTQHFNYLPKLREMKVVGFGTRMLALGLESKSGTEKPFAAFWESLDQGLTWTKGSAAALPANFDRTATAFGMYADEADGTLWIVTSSGQLWKVK